MCYSSGQMTNLVSEWLMSTNTDSCLASYVHDKVVKGKTCNIDETKYKRLVPFFKIQDKT